MKNAEAEASATDNIKKHENLTFSSGIRFYKKEQKKSDYLYKVSPVG